MADEIKQLDLFGEEVRPKAKYVQGQVGKDDYGEFTEKFKAKLTTDDCYTPVEVYEAVLGWLREKVDIEGCNIVRPFWPGGDYEAYDYKEDDVVVDNPPFSILARILRFYQDRGIRFFLFGPQLTLFSSSSLTYIPCACAVEYANGAKVNTGFISNLFGDVLAMSALASQKAVGKAIFGKGWLISEKKAAEKKAAEKKAAEEIIVWELSEAERAAVRRIDKKRK